jgi:peptidyl-prolyl cis-trans isomerase D
LRAAACTSIVPAKDAAATGRRDASYTPNTTAIMLDNLRKHASSWLAKILIALLIASFAVWGIADQITGGGEQVLARVDGQEIPLERFRNTYQQEINRLSRQRGERITAQQAREAGLPDMVLEQLVNAALLDAHARRLGLSVDNETITRRITESPVFQDSEGNFDRGIFEQALRFSNLSEAAVLAQENRALIREQLLGTIGQAPQVPATLVDAMNRYRYETRVIAHFTVGPEAVEDIPEPSESALRNYHEENSDEFLAPETREVAVLDVTPAALADRVDVTDDQVRADYEARQDEYNRPERREIQQIVFQDMASAREGYQELEAGKDFLEVAKQQDMSEDDTRLGTLSKSQISDSAIAEAAFALEEDSYSEPVEGAFSTVILRVNEIEPGAGRSFEDVKDQLRTELTERAAAERIIELRQAIEDERAAGAPLSETAEKFQLPYQVITLDRSGNTPEGEDAPPPADLAAFRAAVFASSVGADEELIERPGGGLIWYEVLNVNPAAEQPFEQVRQQVAEAWRASELRKAIRDKADALVAQARAGEALDELAASVGVTPTQTKPLTRNDSAPGLSAGLIGQAFTLQEDGVAVAAAPEPPARTVFKVEEVIAPDPLSDEEAEQMRTALRGGVERDLTDQYIAALRNNFDYTVNRDVLRQSLGL